MIRHSSSFLISLIIHIALIAILFYTYKEIVMAEPVQEEKLVKMNLCCLPGPEQEIVEEPDAIQEPEIEEILKPIEIPKEKPKPQEVAKKIPIKKPEQEKVIEPIKKKTEPAKEIVQEKKEIQEDKRVTLKEPAQPIQENKIIEKQAEILEPIIQKKVDPQQQYLDMHIQQITKLLSENLYYPRSARKRGIEGIVVVKFTLSKDAKVSMIEVLESKSEILSRAAIQTLEDLSEKFPKPSEVLHLQVPISYNLSR